MPLRLFADRGRAGAYAARFLFNGVLVSFYFFMTQYLQGVSGYTPAAGRPGLPPGHGGRLRRGRPSPRG